LKKKKNQVRIKPSEKPGLDSSEKQQNGRNSGLFEPSVGVVIYSKNKKAKKKKKSLRRTSEGRGAAYSPQA